MLLYHNAHKHCDNSKRTCTCICAAPVCVFVFVRMFGDAFVVVVVYLVDNCDTFLVRTSPLNSTKIVVIVANQNSILNNMEWIAQ